jgi:hypothetical protein
MYIQHLKKLVIIVLIAIIYIVITAIGYFYLYQKKHKQENEPNIIEKLIPDDWQADGCGGDGQCKTCKRKIKCLECMHECYNRYGVFTEAENHFLKKAILCNNVCWAEMFIVSPDTGFDIPAVKPGK